LAERAREIAEQIVDTLERKEVHHHEATVNYVQMQIMKAMDIAMQVERIRIEERKP
jgi:hypothetical protein